MACVNERRCLCNSKGPVVVIRVWGILDVSDLCQDTDGDHRSCDEQCADLDSLCPWPLLGPDQYFQNELVRVASMPWPPLGCLTLAAK